MRDAVSKNKVAPKVDLWPPRVLVYTSICMHTYMHMHTVCVLTQYMYTYHVYSVFTPVQICYLYRHFILSSSGTLAQQEILKGFAQVMNGKTVSKLSEELVNVASQSVTPPHFHGFLFCVRKAAIPHCET